MLTVEPHPLLDLRAFITEFPRPLGDLPTPAELWALFSLAAEVPLRCDESVRGAIRIMLRHSGFKPAGRSKPAAEYLVKSTQDQSLSSINLAVDVCNIVSLHSGVPISVVDLDRVQLPLRVAVSAPGTSYVFNSAGQTIDLTGLLCLHDATGPCANAVKDAQRTKTSSTTQRTLSLVWGSTELLGRAAQTEAWYRSLLEQHGGRTRDAS